MSYLEETDRAQSPLRARLELAAKEKLVEVILRLAADSEESAARIDYLTDPSEAVKIQSRPSIKSDPPTPAHVAGDRQSPC